MIIPDRSVSIKFIKKVAGGKGENHLIRVKEVVGKTVGTAPPSCSVSSIIRNFRGGKLGSCETCTLPPLLARKALVEEGKHLGDIELNIFQVKILQVVLLHLEKVVEFEVKLQQSTGAAWINVSMVTKIGS